METNRKSISELKPFTAIHPGVYIQSELDFLGMTQKELALRTGIPAPNLNSIINGKRGITPAIAQKLSSVLTDYSIEHWLRLQAKFELGNKEKSSAMVYPAMQIAHKVVLRTDTSLGDAITNLKLQKLLYYLQGHFLGKLGRPLFQEPIEAWRLGPVVPIVYHNYKIFGETAIPKPVADDQVVLNDAEEELFEEVYTYYNRYSASALVTMTHEEEPWQSNYNPHRRQELNEIPIEELKLFFSEISLGNS